MARASRKNGSAGRNPPVRWKQAAQVVQVGGQVGVSLGVATLGVQPSVHGQGVAEERSAAAYSPREKEQAAQVGQASGQVGVALGVALLGVELLPHGQGMRRVAARPRRTPRGPGAGDPGCSDFGPGRGGPGDTAPGGRAVAAFPGPARKNGSAAPYSPREKEHPA